MRGVPAPAHVRWLPPLSQRVRWVTSLRLEGSGRERREAVAGQLRVERSDRAAWLGLGLGLVLELGLGLGLG